MTTAAEEPRRDSRLLMLAGHYAWLAGAVTLALSAADDVTGRHVAPLLWVAVAAWALFIIALGADLGHHKERLCERCIATTPLDAQAQAERRRPVLRLHHALKIRTAVTAVLLALSLWVTRGRHPPGWSYLADAVFLAALGVSLGSNFWHRKLYPWCPYCRWGDGGDHEASPDVPAPAVSR